MKAVSAPSLEDLNALAPLAREAARASESFLLKQFGRAVDFRLQGEDAKLAEDRQSEELIINCLSRRSSLPILSEECGWVNGRAKPGQPYWAIDPLDGSYNFLFGIPLFAVAVALCVDDHPLIGCVNDVSRGQLFFGMEGQGFQINGQEVPRANATPSGILATGFPVGRQNQSSGLNSPDLEVRKVRMLGSAALSLAWVAHGRMSYYREKGIRWWDVAAGLALVRAAGGRVDLASHEAGCSFAPLEALDVTATRDLGGAAG